MKIRTYGALTSAFLITLSAGAAQAADASCDCPPKVVHHTAAARPAPARTVRRNADAEAYAQSFYDYNSAGAVSEVIARRLEASLPPEQPWQVAPNDARIRFKPYDVGAAQQPSEVALNDNEQFSGGVGYNAGNNGGGGGGGGFQDGYGQVHFYTGGVGQNGPTFNTYAESFGAGSPTQGGFAAERTSIWHGYNLQTGPGNGY